MQLGAVQDVWIHKSIDRSLDKESARLLEDSPNWIPAEQDGHRVKSYKIQPIRYRSAVKTMRVEVLLTISRRGRRFDIFNNI